MAIYRMIKGYDSRGKNYTDLLEKCPALSFTDRTVTANDDDGFTVRRRTEAFTWSKEIYRQWANGGACRLDRDPEGRDDEHHHDDVSDEEGKNNNKGNDGEGTGSVTALQHVYSSFTASAVNQNGKPGAPGSCKEEYSDNIFVLREGHLQQNLNYGGGKNSGKSSDQCLHDSEIAVNKNRSRTGAAQKRNPAPPVAPDSYSTCCKTAEISPDPAPSAVNKDRVRPIRARDTEGEGMMARCVRTRYPDFACTDCTIIGPAPEKIVCSGNCGFAVPTIRNGAYGAFLALLPKT